jgi:murein DD-endopeptidase MepM/ murein hydrolase activator NlpD
VRQGDLVLAEFLAVLLTRAHAPAYSAPVPGAVVRGFEAPLSAYSAGHRGVDLASTPGEAVRAAGAGEVSFAGELAGRGVIVVLHPDGVRTEYEPVRVLVVEHQRVRRGEVIGAVAGMHGECGDGKCLHWGARRGENYVDPLTLLGLRRRVRLLPWNG